MSEMVFATDLLQSFLLNERLVPNPLLMPPIPQID